MARNLKSQNCCSGIRRQKTQETWKCEPGSLGWALAICGGRIRPNLRVHSGPFRNFAPGYCDRQ